jgi:hypothetical protein
MITELLRAHGTQKFRVKQSFRDHALTRHGSRAASGHPAHGETLTSTARRGRQPRTVPPRPGRRPFSFRPRVRHRTGPNSNAVDFGGVGCGGQLRSAPPPRRSLRKIRASRKNRCAMAHRILRDARILRDNGGTGPGRPAPGGLTAPASPRHSLRACRSLTRRLPFPLRLLCSAAWPAEIPGHPAAAESRARSDHRRSPGCTTTPGTARTGTYLLFRDTPLGQRHCA